MKKRYWLFLLLFFVLIVLDQGAKLLVSNFVTVEDNILLVSNTVHIHPILNDECVLQCSQMAEKTNVSLYFWLVLDTLKTTLGLALPFVLGVFGRKFFFGDKAVKNYPILTGMLVCFIMSGLICHIVGDFFWGGSLDFICISWDDTLQINGVLQNIVRHKSFDLKDFYVYIGKVLLVFRSILEILVYVQNKDIVTEKLKHPTKTNYHE